LRRYDEKIDKTIVEILYKAERELTFKELEDRLKPRLDTFSYETYSNRLKQLSKLQETLEDYNSKEDSKYAIQPVLNRKDEKGRGGKVYYSLTKTARIRCDLNLPILNSETRIEKAYRILSRSLAFENSPYRKLKDENEYQRFLQKLGINENELRLDGKPGYNRNLYKVTNLIHQESGIKFSHTEYLEGSENPGEWEYHYQLPGISIKELIANNNNESEKSKGLAYGHLNFNNDDEVNEYFKLLKDKRLIEKIKSKYLITLNEEDRYVFVDSNNNNKNTDRLKEFFRKCWLLHGSVTVYLVQKWKCIQGPTDEERVWYEHLWGKDRTEQIINGYYEIRTKFNKSKNVKSEKVSIQKLLKSQKIGLQRKFTSINNTYPDIIQDYSYLANPLLNSVYPEFFRN
jgi:DNA-binding Lrp family transcriptional regulator